VAEDNLKILTFIKKESLKGPLLVIFNLRYGQYYVGSPMMQFLEDIPNIEVTTEYIRSIDHDTFLHGVSNKKKACLSNKTQSYLDDNEGQVLFIDGTQNSKFSDSVTRFPSSALGFINAVMGNRDVHFWSVADGLIDGDVVVGSEKVKKLEVTNTQRQVVCILATGDQSNGELDDPEYIFENKQTKCFGKSGVKLFPIASSEVDFVTEVQNQIAKKMQQSLGF
jgi:hypothetical protein